MDAPLEDREFGEEEVGAWALGARVGRMRLGECFLRSHSEASEFGEEEVRGWCFGHFLQSRKFLRLSRCTLIMPSNTILSTAEQYVLPVEDRTWVVAPANP